MNLKLTKISLQNLFLFKSSPAQGVGTTRAKRTGEAHPLLPPQNFLK